MKKIIFVCTGNTCRSPMAEKLATKVLGEVQELQIVSRGIDANRNDSASYNAIKAMEGYGLKLDQHLAHPFDISECSEDTLILTMTRAHKVYLEYQYPQLQPHIFTIKEYVGEVGDVMDPYGKSLSAYEACAKELYQLIQKIGTPMS